MMRTVNKVILIGNVTKDPLIKTTENGKKVAMFNLATNRYYKTATGENASEAEFHNCVAWGNLALRAETSLSKGKLIYVEGRLRTRVIEREDGSKNYKTEVVISSLIFLNKKSDFDVVDDSINEEYIEEDDKF